MPAVPRLRLLCVLLPAAILTLLCGCTQLDLKQPLPWPLASGDKPGVPSRVAAFWTDTVLYKANQPPTRGFGGRVMFYDAQEDKSIKVDGTLVVYAFDEGGRNPGNARPDRKFVFPKESFAKHYSKSELGHSYSVWLPWDQLGGWQKEISLIVRFLPAEGAPVIGEQTKHALPGRLPEGYAEKRTEFPRQVQQMPPTEGQVRPTSHEAPISSGPPDAAEQGQAPANAAPRQRMSTVTIPLPQRYGRQRPVATVSPRTAKRSVTPTQPRTLNRAPMEQPVAAQGPRPGQAAPARQGQLPRQAHFSPVQSRAPGGPTARPGLGRNPWQQLPATSRFAPGSQPPPATQSGPVGNATAVGPVQY